MSWKPTAALTPLNLLVVIAILGIPSAPAGEKPDSRPLGDKTLVAWVALAGLEQRGGSALTVIDDQERFDAIVFGERSPGRWMAGSDFFRRTPEDQNAYPAETADAKTLVGIAVVYQGSSIAIYRNGKPYARYTVKGPQPFRADATVLIGLRYVGRGGEIGFLHGAVEEARLYDRALDEKTIAALAPNRPSDPKPLGLWTFEDGTASDAAGTFPAGTLAGGARIEGGKLLLDGKTAYVEICRARPRATQTMFYRPFRRDTGRMWDTWLYLREGKYFLYYLANRRPQWDNVSLATSPDGVHWTEHGPVLAKREDAVWMGTGSTWKSPRPGDGRFLMNFSEWRGQQQTIFFAESADLMHWNRLGDELEFKPDPRWYHVDQGNQSRWDCIYTIPRPGGGLYGYWTATPKPETGGRFGFGQSLDGAKWEALAPPKVVGAGEGEAGAVERIGDKYYMMFGTGGRMVTLVADRPEGPFQAARKNFNLLAGHTYFSRFFPTPDGVLVNHHSIARDQGVCFAPLKQARVDQEGTLRLAWWKGNERLKHEPVDVKPPEADETANRPIAMLPASLDVDRGVVVEGAIALPAAQDAGRSGLYIECGPERGAAILLARGGAAELGPVQADGSGFKPEKRVDREMTFGQKVRFRLLLKHSLLEFYLDDVLIECFSLPEWSTGRIGLIGGRGGGFEGIQAWYPLDSQGGHPRRSANAKTSSATSRSVSSRGV